MSKDEFMQLAKQVAVWKTWRVGRRKIIKLATGPTVIVHPGGDIEEINNVDDALCRWNPHYTI